LWAKATSLIARSDIEGESLDFFLTVIQDNETVPVILVDRDTNVLMQRNLDSLRSENPEYLKRKLATMMEENPPIEIPYTKWKKQFLYYSRSIILNQLTYYPFIQLGVILLFILVAYFAFSSSRKAEQNQVWVGLSKETAHQLGTPISSLMAWLEIIREKETDQRMVKEFEKDILRLNKITDRFSKIGSQPLLEKGKPASVVNNTIAYLKSRSSDKIKFIVHVEDDTVEAPINTPLFEWVIENVCKNAMDAIDGEGEIRIDISNNDHYVFIDIKDNGKGIAKSQYKTIFKPGYTTKQRGWGLGLSLTKRIVEEYHKGKIFVAGSEMGKGTTIRIIIKR
jgi:signal transduction histidine kinase